MNDYNHRTRITASILGILLGCAGFFNHGIFEVMQGNTATPGFFIEAIALADRFWVHGTEGAFTIMPTFLMAGISVMLVSLAIILWSGWYIHTKYGTSVFLLLFVLLTAVGGGIGHILLFLPTWLYATRINKSLDWWQHIIPEKMQKILAKLWSFGLATTVVCWLIVMELGIFGYFPGQNDADVILNIVFLFLFATVILANATFICAFAADLQQRRFSID